MLQYHGKQLQSSTVWGAFTQDTWNHIEHVEHSTIDSPMCGILHVQYISTSCRVFILLGLLSHLKGNISICLFRNSATDTVSSDPAGIDNSLAASPKLVLLQKRLQIVHNHLYLLSVGSFVYLHGEHCTLIIIHFIYLLELVHP